MATKSSSRATVRESIETPASRATESSPWGGVTPRERATSSTVHRIDSSRGWASRVWGHLCFGELQSPALPVRKTGGRQGARTQVQHPLHIKLEQLHCRAQLAERLISVPTPAQDPPRLFAVVKIDRAVAQDLVGLMPFARQQHDVAG